jgi:hypothetical protein
MDILLTHLRSRILSAPPPRKKLLDILTYRLAGQSLKLGYLDIVVGSADVHGLDNLAAAFKYHLDNGGAISSRILFDESRHGSIIYAPESKTRNQSGTTFFVFCTIKQFLYQRN